MQRINVTVSNEAKDKLLEYQRKHAIKRQDDAVDAILMELRI